MSSSISIGVDGGEFCDFVLCIPVFNDWNSALQLLEGVEEIGSDLLKTIGIIFVDDGSTDESPDRLQSKFQHISFVDVLALRRNVGHQRAIALGLAYIHHNCSARYVVVMDGDGEDSPRDILELIRQSQESETAKIIFAKRRKRSEGLIFRLSYTVYRTVHRVLTGRKVNVGNFSLIPAVLLPRVVGVSELWNHYAAGVYHARLPVDTVPIDRARRLTDTSKMSFVSLVTHGMSAISVFGDTVGVRLLCMSGYSILLVLLGLVVVVALRLFTDLAIPGWASNVFGMLVVILLNLLMLTVVFVLFILQSRNMAGFLPVRDWESYVASRIRIYER